jgi:hypothetical protein
LIQLTLLTKTKVFTKLCFVCMKKYLKFFETAFKILDFFLFNKITKSFIVERISEWKHRL